MQIHEITKTQVNEALGDMVGDLIKGGIAKAISGGSQDPQKVAAAQQQQIDRVATQALPQWLAKRAALERSLGRTQVNFDEELEAWLEDNVFRGYLKMDSVDPRYQQAIKKLINVVNNTTSNDLRQAQFKKLLSTAMMARPSRANAAAASGVIPTKIDPSGKISMGRYTLNPSDKNDAVLIALIQNLQQAGKL